MGAVGEVDAAERHAQLGAGRGVRHEAVLLGRPGEAVLKGGGLAEGEVLGLLFGWMWLELGVLGVWLGGGLGR